MSMFWAQIFLSTEQENIGTLGTSGKIEMTEMSNSGGFCFSILPVTKVDMGLPLWLLSAFLRVFPRKINVCQKLFSFPFALFLEVANSGLTGLRAHSKEKFMYITANLAN